MIASLRNSDVPNWDLLNRDWIDRAREFAVVIRSLPQNYDVDQGLCFPVSQSPFDDRSVFPQQHIFGNQLDAANKVADAIEAFRNDSRQFDALRQACDQFLSKG